MSGHYTHRRRPSEARIEEYIEFSRQQVAAEAAPVDMWITVILADRVAELERQLEEAKRERKP